MKRREFSLGALVATLALPLTTRWALAESTVPDDRIILHKNWILKASDLEFG
jgi:hypothetical protein